MNSPEESAVAAYGGYEYQILVTVWVALDLVIARTRCDSIEIEPASQEDIAAKLNVAMDSVETSVDLATDDGPLEIQIKRRSRCWSTSDFRDLVESPSGRGSRGPAPRERALARLKAEEKLRYVVITDAEVHSDIKDFVVDSIPLRSSATDESKLGLPTSIASRISVLEKRVDALVKSEIDRILEQSARVPLQQVQACRESLVHRVRERLLGRGSSRLDRTELETLIMQHGGFPPSVGDEFVPPANFGDLQRRIDEAPFALLIIGPPGIGKSFAAEKLIEAHRRMKRPFKIEKDLTPYEIRSALATPGRTLFYLEDPWGRYKLEQDAQKWIDELPRLIRDARLNPDKRFLITSRTGLLAESIDLSPSVREPERLQRVIGASVATIQESDFDAALRREILWRWMRRATRWQRDWVEDRRNTIVSQLSSPQAIAWFAHNVKAISSVSDLKLEQLLAESQVAAIGDVVTRQLRSTGETAAGVILWAFLAVGEPLIESTAEEIAIWLAEDAHLSLDIPRLIAHMRANGWLSPRDSALVAHSTVIEGLERLLDQERVIASLALRSLFATLVRRNRFDLASRLLFRLHERHLPISPEVRQSIEQHLRDSLINCDDPRFASAIDYIARISKATDPVSLLARVLGAHRSTSGIDCWALPEWWTEREQDAVRSSPEAEIVSRRYIRHMLGKRGIWFGEEELIDFLCSLGWDLSVDFVSAATEAFKRSNEPINVALHGALATTIPAYEHLLDAALNRLDSVNRWFDEQGEKEQRRANEGEFDAVHSAHVLDEPGERYHLPKSAIEQIVADRRKHEGSGWLTSHPRRIDLVQAWALAIPYESGEAVCEELRVLYDAAADWNRSDVWDAIGRSRCRSLTAFALQTLASGPVSELPPAWGSLFGLYEIDELPEVVSPTLESVDWVRRASIAYASQKADIPSRNDHAYREPSEYRNRALGLLDPHERQALEACSGAICRENVINSDLSPETLALVERLLDSPDDMLAVGAYLVLADPSRARPVAEQRFLPSQDRWVRLHALRTLDSTEPAGRLLLTNALTDPYYQCRRLAMYILSEEPSDEERAMIIKMSSDASAPVRDACARIIGDRQWSDGFETLCGLLKDQRDRNEGGFQATSNPDYHVARAAASALCSFETPLPETVLNDVLEFLRGGTHSSDDLVVHHKLLEIIGTHRAPRLAQIVDRLLRSSWPMGDEVGTFPLRYAVGWSWVAHLVRYPDDATLVAPAVLVMAAEHTDDRLAAPALLALGIAWKQAGDGVRQILANSDISDERALLLDIGARIASDAMPDELLLRRLHSTHPGRQLIAWCWNVDEPDHSWSEHLAANHAMQEWLVRVSVSTPVHAAIRRSLRNSPRGALLTTVSQADFRSGELPEGTPVISTFHFAGLE